MSIILDHVNYIYGGDTPLAVKALDDICRQIPDGEFVGIIGHTGSGKSTLVQHLNGLLKATSGHIYFNGEDIYDTLSLTTASRMACSFFSPTTSTAFSWYSFRAVSESV